VYKNMQANSAAAAANPAAGLPNFVYVGSGAGGSGGGAISGSSQGTAAAATGSTPAAVASSTVAGATLLGDAAQGVSLGVTPPGANPTPVVSAPAAENASSAVVNSELGFGQGGGSRLSFKNQMAGDWSASWTGGGSDPQGNLIKYQRATPGSPEWFATQGGWIAPSSPAVAPSTQLPYQAYLQNQGGSPVTTTPVTPAAPSTVVMSNPPLGAQPYTPATPAPGSPVDGTGYANFRAPLATDPLSRRNLQ